jgi:hypothetical protein
MLKFDPTEASFAALASELAARCAQAIEEGRLDDIPNEPLGQVFASIVRVYACKADEGENGRPFGGNSGVTATDALIGCTAMLEAVGLEVFELGLWQTFTNLGKWRHHDQNVSAS